MLTYHYNKRVQYNESGDSAKILIDGSGGGCDMRDHNLKRLYAFPPSIAI